MLCSVSSASASCHTAGDALPCATWQALQPHLAVLPHLCWLLQPPHQKPCEHRTHCPETPCFACQPPGCSRWLLHHTLPAAPCRVDCQYQQHDASELFKPYKCIQGRLQERFKAAKPAQQPLFLTHRILYSVALLCFAKHGLHASGRYVAGQVSLVEALGARIPLESPKEGPQTHGGHSTDVFA